MSRFIVKRYADIIPYVSGEQARRKVQDNVERLAGAKGLQAHAWNVASRFEKGEDR